MARPPKRGLDYFPFDTDFFDDLKIMDLVDIYGPLGVTVYIASLCIVYREGYYAEKSASRMAQIITRMIGHRWVNRQNLVVEIIRYCGEIGLFDEALLCKDLITSAAIQKRYAEVTSRNKVDKSKYWLLSEKENEDRALESAPD